MRVIVKEPQKQPIIDEIEDNINIYHSIIDCDTIEIVRTPYRDDIAIILDDEGKLTNKTPNFWRYNDKICGTAIFANIKGENLTSLTEEQIRFIGAYLECESI